MKNFFDLSERERVRLTEDAISQRRTLFERWSAEDFGGSWDDRAAIAATFLAGQKSVADIGCGYMTLERMLPASVTYIAVDAVKRDERTIVVDLNREDLPKLAANSSACLGLIGYLFDVPKFLFTLANHFKTSVISYNPTDTIGACKIRRSNAWVNDYSVRELTHLFDEAGLSIDQETILGAQIIWLLTSCKTQLW